MNEKVVDKGNFICDIVTEVDELATNQLVFIAASDPLNFTN